MTEATALLTPRIWWLRATTLRVPPGLLLWLAAIEEDEVLDDVERPVLRQHVQLRQGLAQLAPQHRVAFAVAAQVAGRTEGLVVPGIGALPAERVVEVVGERLLDETVLAVDV